ncbi:MAG: DUF4062 domain-containing protein [Candidatus Dadabacteria bacterium]|nr:DUF4062 domain-containing protein [Candidatus Dadabacteria bacterium]NIS08689.1 DUF4062 domain-containing protein [Candidatus Dadabacteria bacterium]NIY23036.1 DUF4062 domain-containing protein [Candidatus Dadabacteria bacterium]
MAKKTEKRKISVLIASPGDCAKERELVRNAIEILNVGFGDGAGVEFEALGWEDTLASTGRRSQSVINAEIDRCGVFILVLHRRWGQSAPDAKPYSSYTEEVFHRALERWKKEQSLEIFVFFKRVDAGQEADAGPQLQKVLDFRKQLEETRQILYRYIDNKENAFFDEVDTHLRASAKDELSSVDTTRDIIVLPLEALEEVKKAKEQVEIERKKAEDANEEIAAAHYKIEEMQLEIAEDAAKLSKESKIEHAREKFVKLISDSSNLNVLYLAY